jgi:hypothetical protein
MTKLTLRDPTVYRAPLADWPLPLETPCVDSAELGWLHEDLTRYVNGRIRGRSYLIAGHRGAGKTALVTRAVEQLAATYLRQAALVNPEKLPQGPFQRPLLVKLHGPSMLPEPAQGTPGMPSSRAESSAQQTPPQAKSEAATGEPARADNGKSETPATNVEPADKKVAAGVHTALVQITIGLYRALASEVATGFRAHALNLTRHAPGDHAERAAQLALELDSGADPTRLRAHWQAINRLPLGVLWPATGDETLKAHDMRDQGWREISALMTTGQAFQVCTGQMTYKTEVKDQMVRVDTSEVKGSSDFKEALARLGTLGLSALTGVSVLHASGGPASALVGGLAVWLLGSLSLTWSLKSTRTADRLVDYSFIRDFSLETLGRDLPVAITRVRDAGLAPVFVIDELDKVENAHEELARMIEKLKYLVADFGFFCFLVNRDCYEAIETRVRTLAYPPEHTLFSERWLLTPNPDSLLNYVAQLVDVPTGDPNGPFARAVFALNILFEARLNLTEVTRLLARSGHREGAFGTPAELTQPRLLVLASVQLAISQTLRSDRLADRMRSAPSFAQLTIDTLYYPVRRWAAGARDIDLSADTLKRELEERLNSEQRNGHASLPAPGDGGRPLTVSQGDLDVLQEHLLRFLGYLDTLKSLRDAVAGRSLEDPQAPQQPGIPLADIIPISIDKIGDTSSDGKFQFRFFFDGNPITETPGRLTHSQKERAKFFLDYVDEFFELLGDIGLNVDHLANTSLLLTFSSQAVDEARKRLQVALNVGTFDPSEGDPLGALDRFHKELMGNAQKFGALLIIAATLNRDLPELSPVLPLVHRLIRFSAPVDKWLLSTPKFRYRHLPRTPEQLKSWRASLTGWLPDTSELISSISGLDEWSPLRRHLLHHFRKPDQHSAIQVGYSTLIQAAQGFQPGASLAANLAALTVRDWSALAFTAMPHAEAPAKAPYWMLVAALRGLGIDGTALGRLADPDLADELEAYGFQVSFGDMTAAQSFLYMAELIADAPPRPTALLIVQGEEDIYGNDLPNPKRPTLVVDVRDYQEYMRLLLWFRDLGFLGGRILGLADEGDIE